MRTTPRWLLFLLPLLASCGAEPKPLLNPPALPPPPASAPASVQVPAPPAEPSIDVAFQALAAKYIDAYLEVNPVKATELGNHRYDGRWPVVGAEGEKRQRDLLAATRGELARIDKAKLGSSARIDFAVLDNRLALQTFELDQQRRWTNDPVFYTGLVGDGLDPLVTREFASLDDRLESLRQRLEGLPVLLEAAKASLGRPAKVATETAISQNDGLIALVEKTLPPVFEKVPSKKAALDAAGAKALAALRDFGGFLKGALLKRSDGDFRLGKTRFHEKLRFYLEADTPADEVYAAASELLDKTQEEMALTALELWPELFPKRATPQPKTHDDRMRLVKTVLDELAKAHPTNATIVQEASTLTDQAREFVRAHDLVEIPNEPLRVIEMPEYRRGVAVAYCDSSGPFETKRETFFAISPTPKDWSAKRAESFYREYNRGMLAELTIHEAIPGHFLQIGHASRFKSPVRGAFESGPFVEGWAVYTEWLMAKYGFGGPKVRMQRQKMVLRMCVNTILDHDVHSAQMSREAALALMMTQAFQEEGEAAGKWKRAQLTSAQLSTYFYGFYMLTKLRERAEKQPGFQERAFHDKLLSFGSPPPNTLAHLMFGDPLP